MGGCDGEVEGGKQGKLRLPYSFLNIEVRVAVVEAIII